MAPVCYKCQTKMSCTRVGVSVGVRQTNCVYNGDLFTCHTCGSEVVMNFGDGSLLGTNWQPDIYLLND